MFFNIYFFVALILITHHIIQFTTKLNLNVYTILKLSNVLKYKWKCIVIFVVINFVYVLPVVEAKLNY